MKTLTISVILLTLFLSKSDFKRCYDLNSKEFRHYYKNGVISDTIVKCRSYPVRLYKTDSLQIKYKIKDYETITKCKINNHESDNK